MSLKMFLDYNYIYLSHICGYYIYILEFHGRLTPALNSSCSPPKIYSGREFSPHGFQWAEYEQIWLGHGGSTWRYSRKHQISIQFQSWDTIAIVVIILVVVLHLVVVLLVIVIIMNDDALDVLDVLAKTQGLYLVPELRYPCHRCRPCCCRCPPPRRCPPHHRHHHEADALDVLDVLVKTPGLYQVPELRYWLKYLVEKNVIF